MVSKAFIEKKIDEYTYIVRIPRFNKSNSSVYASKDTNLYTATICYLPGIIPYYDINDVVFIAYENGESSNPVILGKLFRPDDNSNSISIIDTEQDNLSSSNLNQTFDSVLEQIDLIKDDIANLKNN